MNSCLSFGPPPIINNIRNHDLTVVAISCGSRMRREAPRCNSPDRQVGVNEQQNMRPEGPTWIHAGPSDLSNSFQQETTTLRSWLLQIGPSDLANHFQHRHHNLTVVAIS
jgi:hypothetical protein